ncbi:MAG: GNAT family N-acetyltransferase [Bacteroidia bacterium]
MITISQVKTANDLKEFIDFPHDLFKGDKNYVPELFIAQRDLLKGTHPFFKHSKTAYFIARKDGKIVGRIAAIKNGNHIEYTGRKEGFFGFFDVINDYEVAKKLLDAATDWVKKEGLNAIVGPTNFSTNETCGLLIDGFDCPPAVMLTYNKPYYAGLLEKYGFGKKMDMYAYRLIVNEIPNKPETTNSLEERLKKRGITIRRLEMKKFKDEVKKVKEIYNSAWDKNWGFVPMTDAEFDIMAKDMKMILDPDFALLAEQDGMPIGFSLTIPDINFILQKIPRGRLLPFGLFKLLYYKSKAKNCRVITLGVLEKYRRMGIDACFYSISVETAKSKGFVTADASWILENNIPMNRALVNLNGKVYKTYRMYELNIPGAS